MHTDSAKQSAQRIHRAAVTLVLVAAVFLPLPLAPQEAADRQVVELTTSTVLPYDYDQSLDEVLRMIPANVGYRLVNAESQSESPEIQFDAEKSGGLSRQIVLVFDYQRRLRGVMVRFVGERPALESKCTELAESAESRWGQAGRQWEEALTRSRVAYSRWVLGTHEVTLTRLEDEALTACYSSTAAWFEGEHVSVFPQASERRAPTTPSGGLELARTAIEVTTGMRFDFEFGQSLEQVRARIARDAKYTISSGQAEGNPLTLQFEEEKEGFLSRQVALAFNQRGELAQIQVMFLGKEKDMESRCEQLERSTVTRLGEPAKRWKRVTPPITADFTGWEREGRNITITRFSKTGSLI